MKKCLMRKCLMKKCPGVGEFSRSSIDPETTADRSGLKNDAERRQNQLRRPILRPFHGHFKFRNIIIGRVWVPICASEGHSSPVSQAESPPQKPCVGLVCHSLDGFRISSLKIVCVRSGRVTPALWLCEFARMFFSCTSLVACRLVVQC